MKDFVSIVWTSLLLIVVHESSPNVIDTYSGFAQVIRCIPASRSDLMFLNSLRSNLYYDFWLYPRQIHMPVDIMAEGFHLLNLKSSLQENNIRCKVFIEDVPTAVKINLKTNQESLSKDRYFEAYHNYEEIVKWMKNLKSKYPNEITLMKVGRSYLGRPMYVLKISRKTNKFKPALWVDGGVHGREWISPAVVTYMLNELVTNRTYAYLLENINFYFMPVVNPDGYDYTFQEDERLWRKSRSWSVSDGLCRGVDVNRNWDFHWNGTGDPCSDNYPGKAPFSEKEIIQTKHAIMNNIVHLKGYVSYHSYAQLWLFPWGYTTDVIDDFYELAELSGKAVDAIYTYAGTRYEQQQYCVEPDLCVSGDSVDYLKGVAKLKYTFLIQLPDLGNYGFLLPPSEIIPVGEESLRGLLVVVNAIVND